MAASFKFKSIWYSFLQSQNGALIQKSVKHVNNNNPKGDKCDEDSEKTSDSSSPSMMTDDYRLRREKNNESVRKSRAKNRLKMLECSTRVENLRSENTDLNKKLGNLQSELFTLKGLFQYCFSFDLNQLAVKPSDIPTSTLHQVIMENKSKLSGGSECTDIDSDCVLMSPHASTVGDASEENGTASGADADADAYLTETDYYNINQIKNALCNIVKSDDSELEASHDFMDAFAREQNSEQIRFKNLATIDHDYLV